MTGASMERLFRGIDRQRGWEKGCFGRRPCGVEGLRWTEKTDAAGGVESSFHRRSRNGGATFGQDAERGL